MNQQFSLYSLIRIFIVLLDQMHFLISPFFFFLSIFCLSFLVFVLTSSFWIGWFFFRSVGIGWGCFWLYFISSLGFFFVIFFIWFLFRLLVLWCCFFVF